MNRNMFICALLMGAAQWIACDVPRGPLDPEEQIVKFEPPPSFKVHWDKVAACIMFPNANARYKEITFYRVGENVLFACRENDRGCYGLFVRRGVRIYLSGGKLEQEDWFVIEHEFAHAMLMDRNHSLPAWEKCGLDKKFHWEQMYYLILSEMRVMVIN